MESTEVKINSHSYEIKRLDEKVSKLEQNFETLANLTISVNQIATSTDFLVKEQKKQSERLFQLERKPMEEFKHFKRIFYASIVTAIGGAIAAVIIYSIMGN